MANDFFQKIEFNTIKPQKGRLLISEPFLFDTYFKRTVIFLVEHGDDGSVGFILNKSVNLRLNEVVPDFPKIKAGVFFGGPVTQNSLFYIHTLGKQLPDSKKVIKDVYWGGDFEQLKLLIDTNQVTNEQIRFFAGYSGWSEGQLEEELKEKSWIVAKTDAEQVMKGTTKEFWNNVLKGMGKKYEIMSNFPEDPTLN
ncbi:MAG: hypothetical protein COA57_09100 [Flavobacteriales bacterium]|nr:MAG: hypothetical protein COA57_09100 [Flavobacteriales bacterium]